MIKKKVSKTPVDKFKATPNFKKEVLMYISQVMDEKLESSFKQNQGIVLNLKKITQRMEEVQKRLESIEETFELVYLNIKRNQFMYSHYPEDWWDDNYIQIKEHLKKQSKDYLNQVNKKPKKNTA